MASAYPPSFVSPKPGRRRPGSLCSGVLSCEIYGVPLIFFFPPTSSRFLDCSSDVPSLLPRLRPFVAFLCVAFLWFQVFLVRLRVIVDFPRSGRFFDLPSLPFFRPLMLDLHVLTLALFFSICLLASSLYPLLSISFLNPL